MWSKKDEFLKPVTPAAFKAPQPGNVGGVNLGNPVVPAVKPVAHEIEPGTRETLEARHEAVPEQNMKFDDTPKPTATDAGMARLSPLPQFRTDGVESLARAFDLPDNREMPAADAVTKGSGDFTDCMTRIVPKVNPDDPEAFCADYEHRQTGHWPGEKRKKK